MQAKAAEICVPRIRGSRAIALLGLHWLAALSSIAPPLAASRGDDER